MRYLAALLLIVAGCSKSEPPAATAVESSPAATDVAQPAAAQKPTWTPLGKPCEVDSVRITVTSAELTPLRYGEEESAGKKGTVVDSKPELLIRFTVENFLERRLLDYVHFSSSGELGATLTDDTGKRYGAPRSSPIKPLTGQLGVAFVEPGKSVQDVLGFEKPAEGIKFLHLELPGDLLNLSDKFRFEIPANAIKSVQE